MVRQGKSLEEKSPRIIHLVDMVLAPVERNVKERVFGCHMCGQCVLHSTGLTCPMECPKNLRNGPCGGVGLDGSCEVDRSKTCVWFKAVNRAQRLPWKDEIHQRNPPVDWQLRGTSSWVNALTGSDHHERTAADWRAATMPDIADAPWRSGSQFERRLRRGQFVVTCEINPRDTADPASLVEYVGTLVGNVDAAHISDNSLAAIHMSNLAAAALVESHGLETIIHVACRDRNRLQLQTDVLGASAVGVKNILCLGGDHPAIGEHYSASKPVFDLDSIHFINAVKDMRDKGKSMSGRALAAPPRMLIGGAAAPTAPPLAFRPHRLGKKAAAGVDFIVTQLIFDMELFRKFMEGVRDLGLDKKVYILVGVGALPSARAGEAINRHSPGVVIPKHVIDRMRGVPKNKQRAEGIKICVEQIQEFREMEGIAGIDLMDLKPDSWFPSVQIAEAAGLLPRPSLPSDE